MKLTRIKILIYKEVKKAFNLKSGLRIKYNTCAGLQMQRNG